MGFSFFATVFAKEPAPRNEIRRDELALGNACG